MKLREKSNMDICDENKLPYTLISNVVEEKDSKAKMRATSNIIAKALIATLGPYASTTIIEDREGKHFATKDGYDLMNRISFEDEVSRTILDLFRTAASNQVNSVGDGSTSAIVVANALFQTLTDKDQIEHFKKISPKDIVDILNFIANIIEEELKKSAKKLSPDMHELDKIAAIANNNDYEVGHMIADIYRKIGVYGFITQDYINKQDKDTYELKSGIEWNRGYIDKFFFRDSNKNNLAEGNKISYVNNPKVILFNTTMTYDDLELVVIPLMKQALNQENSELLIVANDYSAEAIEFLKTNRIKHLTQNTVEMIFTPVDIDQVTDRSKHDLEDLATLCNCRIYDRFTVKPAEVIAHPEEFVGTAGKVVITEKTTQVLSVKASEMSSDHTKSLAKKIKEFNDDITKLNKIEDRNQDQEMKLYELKRRLSNLTDSTAVLYVGGKTLTERMTRSRLIDDAILACKSAMTYGYIPGGNLCIPKLLLKNKEGLCNILGEKYNYLPIDNIRTFFSYFIDTLANTFLESYRAVLSNSYMSEDEVEKTIKVCLNEDKFYNLKLHRYEDWTKTEVINSVETDIQIMESCISIIGILSTSNQFLTLNANVVDQIRLKKE
jgi:chaperonin GroEL